MALEGEDFGALLQYLDAHPEMRDELRRRVLADEFLQLPLEVHELRLVVEQLAARMDQLTARMDQLTARMDQLAARMDQLAERMDQFTSEITSGFAKLTGEMVQHRITVDKYAGPMYEMLFRLKAPSLFGTWLRRPRVVELDDVPGFEEREAAGEFTDAELIQLRALDLLVRGGDKSAAPAREVFLAVEISITIDNHDVERARDRAALLTRLGVESRPAVAGTTITERAQVLAGEAGAIVRLVTDAA